MIRVFYGDEFEFGNSGEIGRVAGVERKVVCDRRRGDHGVIGAGGGFSARGPQRGRNSATSAAMTLDTYAELFNDDVNNVSERLDAALTNFNALAHTASTLDHCAIAVSAILNEKGLWDH